MHFAYDVVESGSWVMVQNNESKSQYLSMKDRAKEHKSHWDMDWFGSYRGNRWS